MNNEDLKIFIEDFTDFLNGLEALTVKLRRQVEKLIGASGIPEQTFNALKWQNEKGAVLGDYEVAYRNQNVLENWQHAYNILKANNSLISNPFHEAGYEYRYWIYPEKYGDRIFRKKLKEAKING